MRVSRGEWCLLKPWMMKTPERKSRAHVEFTVSPDTSLRGRRVRAPGLHGHSAAPVGRVPSPGVLDMYSRQATVLSRYALHSLALAFLLAAAAPSARANVYATNIKLNGSLASVSVAPGTSVSISYILNESAASVTIKILSGATAVRTMTGAGAARGLNTASWDGKDDSNVTVPGGNYSVSITASSSGYAGPAWTLTTSDTNPGNKIWEPRGIALDRNTNSVYYGRVFAANAIPNGTTPLGYQRGILKCNADGSYADEGGFSTGGHTWPTTSPTGYAPWKLQVSDDDYVYIEDWANSGDIYRWDPTLSTPAGGLHVLRSDNWYSTSANMSGPTIFGTGTNTEIWMADVPYPNDHGILRWTVSSDGTCAANDKGTQIVKSHLGSDLQDYPWDVAVDTNHDIYTIQARANPGDSAWRVLKFPAYSGTVDTTAIWKIGSGYGGSDWLYASGISVDPTATYVAVAFRGSSGTGGNTKILSTVDGTVITSLDLGVSLSGQTKKADYDVDWDAVGNVYLVDEYVGVWRAYSPPGANSATTVAVPVIQVTGPAPATLAIAPGTPGHYDIAYSGGSGLQFVLVSSTNVTAAMNTWARVATNSATSGTFSVIIGPGAAFYRVKSE
ncbi:MAG: hypothetical protein C5B50_29000 [Verrucomicrobia bacterium]|nr:MAG: hypothetical protein C5B50_29000 [Verrucomicrobiota bacterium]